MLLEVRVEAAETEPNYFTGQIALHLPEDNKTRFFEFVLSDRATEKQQFLVRHDNKIFLNIQGKIEESSPPFPPLSDVQELFLTLVAEVLHAALQRIQELQMADPYIVELQQLIRGKLGKFLSQMSGSFIQALTVDDQDTQDLILQLLDS